MDTPSNLAVASGVRPVQRDSAFRLDDYQRTLTHSVQLRTHLEVLVWLQGDMQRYLPHDIMIAAWGNFSTGSLRCDIISIVHGVRSLQAHSAILTPLLVQLYANWQSRDKKAFVHSNLDLSRFIAPDTQSPLFSEALRSMKHAVVHGIKDERGSHDCLYLALSSLEEFPAWTCNTLTQVLPYIDYSLRQVEHLPHQSGTPLPERKISPKGVNLTARETEILHWIALGKTNSETGSILEMSQYSVKNHVQRIFKKLNVSNRAQAVAVLTQHA